MKAGDVLASKYLLVARVGQGGMGSVWRVEHTQTGREFAVKVLHPSVATSEDSRHRFMLEARASAKINHSNIIDIFDIGETDDGSLYLVMELLDGISLSEALRCDPPFNAREMLHLISGVATALAAAHGAGVIHRDIKPPNIFLHRDRASGYVVAKILDFGVSKVLAGDDGISTHTGSLLGSPRYMAPEQAHSATAADGRSDIWSLGVVLFEALTGRFPHDGDSSSSLVIAIGTKPPKSIHAVAPQLPLPLRLVIDDCLKPQDERIQTAELFVDRIQTILATNDLTDVVLARSTIGKGKVQPRPEGFTIKTIAPNAVGISSLGGRSMHSGSSGTMSAVVTAATPPARVTQSQGTPARATMARPQPPAPAQDPDEQTVMRLGLEDAIEEAPAPSKAPASPPPGPRSTSPGRPPAPPPARTSVPSIRPPQIARTTMKAPPLGEVTRTVAQPTMPVSPRSALPFNGTMIMQDAPRFPDPPAPVSQRSAPSLPSVIADDPSDGDENTRVMASPLADHNEPPPASPSLSSHGVGAQHVAAAQPAPPALAATTPFGPRPAAPQPASSPEVDPTFESISSINVATGTHQRGVGDLSLAAPMVSPLAVQPRKKVGLSTIVALVGAFSLMVVLVGLVIQQSRQMSAEAPVAVKTETKAPAASPENPPASQPAKTAEPEIAAAPSATADASAALLDDALPAPAATSTSQAPQIPGTSVAVAPPSTNKPIVTAAPPSTGKIPKPTPSATGKPSKCTSLDCMGSGLQ